MRLFHKIFLSHLAVAVAALIIASGFTGYKILSQTRRWMMDQLAVYGREAAQLLQDRDWNSQEMLKLQATFNALERGQDANAWLVDRKGLIRLTSATAAWGEASGVRLPPEAWDDLLAGRTVTMEPTPMGPHRYPLTVAVPVLQNGQVVGAVVLRPVLHAVRWRDANPWLLLLYGALVAGAVVAPFSYLIARQIARPINLVSEAGKRVARGDFAVRVDWQAPDEIGDLAQGFNEMAGELGRLEVARKELMTHVSHELKGPLARIAGYIEAIHDGIGGEAGRQEHFEIVRQEVSRLTRLVNDLLDASRLEAGRLKLHLIPCDLAPYLSRAAAVFEAPAQQGQIALDVKIPPSLPIVLCEPERVEQVLVNLLQNALTHTPPGGSIRVRAFAESRNLVVTVADTGPGIPAEELPMIWERFHKIDRARTPDKSGSGLGLTIVRQLIELQGGQVWVESAVGAGSRFGFKLPLATPET